MNKYVKTRTRINVIYAYRLWNISESTADRMVTIVGRANAFPFIIRVKDDYNTRFHEASCSILLYVHFRKNAYRHGNNVIT